MIRYAIPVLPITNTATSIKFYCEGLGFQLDYSHPQGPAPDPCYSGVSRDGANLHLSSRAGDGTLGETLVLRVDDVDALHAELLSRGTPIEKGPINQPWGTREVHVKDPDGNIIKFLFW